MEMTYGYVVLKYIYVGQKLCTVGMLTLLKNVIISFKFTQPWHSAFILTGQLVS